VPCLALQATESHIGLLKARLAKLKSEVVTQSTKASGGRAGDGFDVTKVGDVRVGMVGFPSVGKSSLLTRLTGTKSEVAAYEFTTLTCIPGTIHYRGARIQLLDMPGIIEGAKDGKGRGRQVISTARTCDVILIVLDAAKPLTHKRLIEHELEGFGIRLNKRVPNIVLTRKEKGGIAYRSSLPQPHLDEDLVKSICAEYKLHNAEIQVRYAGATADDLIDVIEGNRKYVPCLYVLNKIDSISIEELDLLDKVPHYVPVSAHHEWNFDELLEKIWEYSGCIRCVQQQQQAPRLGCKGGGRRRDLTQAASSIATRRKEQQLLSIWGAVLSPAGVMGSRGRLCGTSASRCGRAAAVVSSAGWRQCLSCCARSADQILPICSLPLPAAASTRSPRARCLTTAPPWCCGRTTG